MAPPFFFLLLVLLIVFLSSSSFVVTITISDMFFVDDKIKVNRFMVVAIPRNSEYLRRFGNSVAPTSSYTGDDIPPLPANKVDMYAQAEQYDAMMQRVEREREQAERSNS